MTKRYRKLAVRTHPETSAHLTLATTLTLTLTLTLVLTQLPRCASTLTSARTLSLPTRYAAHRSGSNPRGHPL